MSTPAERIDRLNRAQLAKFGRQITYLPNQGKGDAFPELAILCQPLINQQSTAPGYFADIEVLPGAARERKDVVIWPDDTRYIVSLIRDDPDSLTRLALHKQMDPL